MAKSIFEQLGGTYEQQGDYLLPCRKRTAHRDMGATAFAVSERIPQSDLHNPAHKRQAERLPYRLFRLVEQMKQAQGITEQLKTQNALEWVQRMNNIRTCAREIVEGEIIYA